MKPSELSRYWIGQGVAEITADPVHFWHHSIRKVRLFFNDYEILNNQSYQFFRREVAPLLRLPLPTYGALIPLALWGMLAARRNRAALLLSLYFWSYLPMVVLFYNVSRYRMPVVPVVIVFAAAGIADISRKLVARDVRRIAPAALLLTLAYPVVHQDLVTESFAVQHFNIAVNHLRRARAAQRAAQDQPELARAEGERAEHLRDLAEKSLLRGLEIDPKHAELRWEFRRFGLERAEELERDGRHEHALALLEDLVRYHPRLAEGHARAGALYRRLGRSGDARRELERAISLDPAHALARQELEELERGLPQNAEGP
jgi:tetratricopeptide (TPR) repeat protein